MFFRNISQLDTKNEEKLKGVSFEILTIYAILGIFCNISGQ